MAFSGSVVTPVTRQSACSFPVASGAAFAPHARARAWPRRRPIWSSVSCPGCRRHNGWYPYRSCWPLDRALAGPHGAGSYHLPLPASRSFMSTKRSNAVLSGTRFKRDRLRFCRDSARHSSSIYIITSSLSRGSLSIVSTRDASPGLSRSSRLPTPTSPDVVPEDQPPGHPQSSAAGISRVGGWVPLWPRTMITLLPDTTSTRPHHGGLGQATHRLWGRAGRMCTASARVLADAGERPELTGTSLCQRPRRLLNSVRESLP